jgi:hypothetical protein
MKLILIAALLISFGNDPAVMLSLDNDHSLEFLSEHGVDHLVLFHRAVDSENVNTYVANPSRHEHHEVHLSSLTGLIQKRLQTSSLQMEISSAPEHTYALNSVATNSGGTFEPDVGSAQLPIQVLRI